MRIFSLLLRLIWVQETLTHENTLHAEFPYHLDLYCIVLTINWLCQECLHASVYGSHSIKFAYIKKESIFVYMCTLDLFFKFSLCFFIFPHLQNFPQNHFSQNLFCFFLFYRGGGGKLFLKPMLFIRGFVALHRGVASIFYRANFFYAPLVLYFFLSSIRYVYYLLFVWVVFVNMWQKWGEIDEIWKRFLTIFI